MAATHEYATVLARHGNVDSLVRAAKRHLERGPRVTLCALERAIVPTLDAARMLSSPQGSACAFAELAGLQTSYVDVTDKTSGVVARRCKLTVTLQRTPAFLDMLKRKKQAATNEQISLLLTGLETE